MIRFHFARATKTLFFLFAALLILLATSATRKATPRKITPRNAPPAMDQMAPRAVPLEKR